MFRRRAEPPITRDDVNLIMVTLMRIEATLDDIRRLVEDEDDEEEEDRS